MGLKGAPWAGAGFAMLFLAGCAPRPVPTTYGVPPAPTGATLLPGLELAYGEPIPTWLDDRRVLVVAADMGRRWTNGSLEVHGENHAYIVDTKTGRRTVFKPLEGMFTRGRGIPVPGQKGVYLVARPARLLALPGGRWILAMKTGEAEPWTALSTTGRPARRWSLPEDAHWHPVGLPDGRRWVAATRVGGFQILVHDCESAKGDRSLPVEAGPGAEEAVRTGWMEGTLGRLADGRLLVKLGTPNGSRYVAIRLGEDRAVAESFDRTEKNDDIGVHELAVSPDGARRAYRSERQTVAVSGLRGENAVDVAPIDEPEGFAWSPDSKRLLFVENGMVWCIAAPR